MMKIIYILSCTSVITLVNISYKKFYKLKILLKYGVYLLSPLKS